MLPLPGSAVYRSEDDFGLGLGGGVDFLFAEHWGIGAELRLSGYFVGDEADDPSSHWYVTPSAYLVLRP